MKAHGDVDAMVHIFAATALGRGRVTSPSLGRLHPRKAPVLILQENEGPQNQSGHEEVEKNLLPFEIRDRTRTVQLGSQALAS